jgi:hypothetical protein
MLVQVGYLLIKNESDPRKSDIFCRFHKAIGHNIDECEEFHQKVIQMMTHDLLQIEKEEKDDVIGVITQILPIFIFIIIILFTEKDKK